MAFICTGGALVLAPVTLALIRLGALSPMQTMLWTTAAATAMIGALLRPEAGPHGPRVRTAFIGGSMAVAALCVPMFVYSAVAQLGAETLIGRLVGTSVWTVLGSALLVTGLRRLRSPGR